MKTKLKSPLKHFLLTVAVASIYCAGSPTVSAVTITSNIAKVTVNSSSYDSFSGTSIPTSHLLSVDNGDTYSRNQIDYTGSGDQVTLSNQLDQKRSGAYIDHSLADSFYLYFTVDADTTYDLSGAYTVTDVTTAGNVHFYTRLYDVTTDSYIAISNQQSYNTLNESFVLGGLGGDIANHLSGSLSGDLIAGHSYRWDFNALTHAYPDADGGASATGFFQLDIGGGAPSNAPDGGSTIALLGLAMSGIAAARRKLGFA